VAPDVEASYAAIIDGILTAADLDTISAKAIRKRLQAAVNYDVTPQKVCESPCFRSLDQVSIPLWSFCANMEAVELLCLCKWSVSSGLNEVPGSNHRTDHGAVRQIQY